MEGVGAFLHLASWWCKSTCCRRSGILANLGGFLSDIDYGYRAQTAQFPTTSVLLNIKLIVLRRQITS